RSVARSTPAAGVPVPYAWVDTRAWSGSTAAVHAIVVSLPAPPVARHTPFLPSSLAGASPVHGGASWRPVEYSVTHATRNEPAPDAIGPPCGLLTSEYQ